MFVSEAFAAGGNQAAGGQQPGIMNILPMMLVMIVIFYFFIIRPQSKRQKEAKNLLDSIKKGDKVVTIGGVLGLVTDVKGNVVTVKIAPNTEVEFKKTAIASIVTAEAEKELKSEPKG